MCKILKQPFKKPLQVNKYERNKLLHLSIIQKIVSSNKLERKTLVTKYVISLTKEKRTDLLTDMS